MTVPPPLPVLCAPPEPGVVVVEPPGARHRRAAAFADVVEAGPRSVASHEGDAGDERGEGER
ncbi:MAG: hypothetical protein QM756_10715 [Polyangiaceae bacterium]